MTDAVIILDRSKPFSECRGERQADDPHYRVAYWQGQMIGKEMVLLPFDAAGNLVPDDGKTEAFRGFVGLDEKGQPITAVHYPLYNASMRKLLELKKKRQAAIAAKGEADEDDLLTPESGADEVNFVAWLTGQAKYEWPFLQVAAKKRFSRMYTSKQEMVRELVLDERVISEDQLAKELRAYLPQDAAA